MKKQKRILMLGGNHVQMTAIQAALDNGYYVITADYLPDNPGHKLANEYHNISTLDKEAILQLAIEKQIDGILSYASDVSAPTAAYVAEKLGLPTNPYESVMILTHKDMFRKFMKTNGLPMPVGETFDNLVDAWNFYENFHKTVIVKPTDSSGSKGVTMVSVDSKDSDFISAWKEAIKYSHSGQIIVEEFIEKEGYQIDGDIFMVDGEIRFWGICDQHHDDFVAPYVPVGLSYPSIESELIQKKAKEQLNKIFKLLGMRIGGYNIEYIIGKDQQVYILEIGPRNGGNLIPDTIQEATGFDMASYVVRQAVGDDVSDACQMPLKHPCSSYIIHSQKDGVFNDLIIAPEIQNRIKKQILYQDYGSVAHKFVNGGFGIGGLVLGFETLEQMCKCIDNMNDYIKVETEKQ